MNELQVFGFEGRNVRVVEKDGNPWWVAKDVADILDYSDTEAMTRKMDDDEIMTDKLSGMNMNSTFINESGVYSAILRSSKPEAKSFKKWITSEVLPSIRKTGSYGMPEIVVLPPVHLIQSVNRAVSLKLLEPKDGRAIIFAACSGKQEGSGPGYYPQKPTVQTPILPAVPALDTFLSLPDFAGWREKLDENPGCFEKMGVKVLKNRAGLQDLAIDHNHKILLRAAGRDYKARLRTDPRYLETRQVHIAHGQVSALIFGWRAVKGGE